MSELPHIPVMADEILKELEPSLGNPTAIHGDGTFGRGGHTRLILDRFPTVTVVACDQDAEAIAWAHTHFASEIQSGRLIVLHSQFSDLANYSDKSFNTILLDLGVSSPQLDEGERGFSFINPGPLDMRMDLRSNFTAADIVNGWTEKELIKLFQDFGEIRSPFRVVKAIVHDRKQTPFTETTQLAGMIARVSGWRKKGFHPATQYFMALRLEVNQELNQVEVGIKSFLPKLRPGGRMAVITFHSLEDRIVKNIFKQSEFGRPVHKKVLVPTEEEVRANPRSRSAKLRVFERFREEDALL